DENLSRQFLPSQTAKPDHDPAEGHQRMHQQAAGEQRQSDEVAAANRALEGEQRQGVGEDARRQEVLVDVENSQAAEGKPGQSQINERDCRESAIWNQGADQAKEGPEEQRVEGEVESEES